MDKMDDLIKESLLENLDDIECPSEDEMFARIISQMEQNQNEELMFDKKPRHRAYKYMAAVAVFLLAIAGFIHWQPHIANAVGNRIQTWAIKNGVIEEQTKINYADDASNPIQQNADKLPTRCKNYKEVHALAPFTIKEPAYIPEGFNLSQLELAGEPYNVFTATYEKADKTIRLIENYCPDESASSIGYDEKNSIIDKIKINGHDAIIIYNKSNDVAFLAWQEFSVKYSVYTTLGKDETLKIANELK